MSSISPFFLNLRSAYQSEIDDLTFDSDGRDVLRQRLGEKRREIGFLVQMMELSPEMVAVVFHQGFAFSRPTVMDRLLGHDADELPHWSDMSDGIELTGWADELAKVVLKAPGGEWFMTVAAALQYMAGKIEAPVTRPGDRDSLDESAEEDREDHDDGDEDEFDLADESEDGEPSSSARARREAGADWLVAQGFDRKD